MPISAGLFGLASFLAAAASFLSFTSAKSASHEILGVALGPCTACPNGSRGR
jgi:hypothetical protein